ncbi:ABC transporter related protein [Thermogladius calderae 1633]|uniref:ABC transporter related protein n=1 Tax=Thermogladius calderae (strain DSM 22663 / VKM B-2946 / 1633) TaxID=1184251 RepID=I3TFQ4_THEC1|nr:ABC transporter ATP-binding protein [Thermogladius calderae]AFK51592.1 ABC transporter related protein [Thermogladius calderae 1633]
MSAPAVEIRDLWFKYLMAEDWTLKNLNLTVERGEFVVLMGPSGCGKSTLMYILTGIIPNMVKGTIKGTVRILGRDILKLQPQEIVRDVGFVFQNPDSQIIMPSVLEEVIFGLENLGLPPDEIRERAEEIIKYVGLWEKKDLSPWSLSAGERQILAIASVLALRPKVMILDEPTSMLDHRGTRRVLDLLDRLKRDYQMTIIVVEHRIEWASKIADKIVIMDKGEFVAVGKPSEVFSNYELIMRVGVRPPMISEVFYKLMDKGVRVDRIPVTAREAVELIKGRLSGGR